MVALAWFGLGCAVFLAAAIYDIATARYVAACADGRAAPAAAWSAMTSIVGLVGLLSVLKASPWLAIPEVAGVAVGTFIGVARRESGRSR